MQIKAAMEYFYTPARTAKVKWQAIPSVAKNVELSYIADGYVNWYNHFGKLFLSVY